MKRLLGAALAVGCALAHGEEYYGTLEPFVSEAVYFVLTDRFVDGDQANNHPQQGGEWGTFDRPDSWL